MFRRLLALLALVATAEAPPPALTPYIDAGHFAPGDYGWMRGAFAGAAPADQAAWSAIRDWQDRCSAAQRAALKTAFAARGINSARPGRGPTDSLCTEVSIAMPQLSSDDWSAFQRAVAAARPVVTAVIWSAALAQASADETGDGLTEQLIARPMTDQVLRTALGWGDGEVKGAPPLDPTARAVAQATLWVAITQRDRANTDCLKAIVASRGWPTIPKVGAPAAHSAWLLVQHADNDPLFQSDMLRLMEPLVAKGDVDRRDFAFLYDRVTLPITGKQRYGTQFSCGSGPWAPFPLEDAAQVDTLRGDAGLEPIADNLARIERDYGPCTS